ncbi:MAG TPA: bacillithiol biosynthesis cysteine-adding enzyme BshC [Melioribacteraceae bacterium]|nr:bacillithiol biosynthesis cysteine-adding enzyme BshC [Melioribacteraceae bacterium]
MFIDYKKLPNQNNLFLDYIYDFSKVKNFYIKDFRKTYNYIKHFEEVCYKQRPFAKELSEIIKKQYGDISVSKTTENNIKSIAGNNTIAIVTGQQLGIFGGPLYTFYKIITAIKLSIELKNKFYGYNFIPVFWLEGDDHDFEEVNNLSIINKENNLINIKYDDNFLGNFRSNIGNHKLKSEFNLTLHELENNLRKTDFTAQLYDNIITFYREGRTFKEAFRDLLFNLFDDFGLVLFDPQSNQIKNLLKPIFFKELDEYRNHLQIAIDTSASLEVNYHAQVKIKPINMFLSENDGRFLLEPDEDNFKLKNKRKKYTKEELIDLLKTHPERFSPNVLLRPICQDFLLPTGFYVAGPGEISYFAQVIPFYKEFNIVQPYIYPRASITLIEKNIKELFEKYNLSFEDIMEEENRLIKKVLNTASPLNIDELFIKSENNIKTEIKTLEKDLLKIDKNLEEAVTKSTEKIIQTLQTLKSRTEKVFQSKNDVTLRQLNKMKNLVYPNNNFQERELNYIYFANKYGVSIIKHIFNEISVGRFEHQIIEL